jgi:acyl dehydratase
VVKTILHLEDFTEGQVFALGPRLVSAEEIIAFAREFDPQPFHVDEEAARQSVLGGLAASGWHTTCLLTRLMCDAVLRHSAVLGSSGMDEVKWLKPVMAGDVLSGDMRATAARPSSSRPGIGIVSFEAFLAGQDGTRRTELKGMVFVRRRSP